MSSGNKIKFLFPLLLCLLLSIQSVSCANILVIDSMPSPSHHLWLRTLSYKLAEDGHNVTALSCYIESEKVPQQLHYLHLEQVEEAFSGDNDYAEIGSMNMWQLFNAYQMYFQITDDHARNSTGFKALLDYPKDFHVDLIIFDTIVTPSFYIFAEKFNRAKVITASAYTLPYYANKLDGIPYSFSYIACDLMMDSVVTLKDRLKNLVAYAGVDLYESLITVPAVERELRKILPEMRPLTELRQLPLIHLVNYHPLVDDAQPIMPNIIPVGGLQIQPAKPLPEDLQAIYDDPKTKGVVLFSLGTNLKSESLGEEIISGAMKTLGEFPEYNFIWKIQLKEMRVAVPRNVFVRRWLPQHDLLGHNKTKLFISHAGGLSNQETQWYGVPMLCIPGFLDQFPVRAFVAWETMQIPC